MNVTTDSSLWQRTNDLFFSLFLLLLYSAFKVTPIITSFSLSCILMSFLKWKRKKHPYSCSRISELREALCTVPPKTSCWYQWQLTLTDDFWTGTGLSTHPLPQLTLRAYERSISLSPFYKVEQRLRKANDLPEVNRGQETEPGLDPRQLWVPSPHCQPLWCLHCLPRMWVLPLLRPL